MKRDELRAIAMGSTAEVADVAEEAEAEAPAPEAPTGQAPVAVLVRKSTAAIVQSGLKLSGKTEAARLVDIRSETSGLVISEPIRKGATVTKGDVLCRLDVGTREASLAEAKAKLAEAQINSDTAQKLAERGFSSETAAISSTATLQAVEAMVQQAEKEIARLTIAAPFDGLLESDTAELGSLLQPGTSCATLISLDPIRIVGYVPETDVEKLRVGSQAGARLSTGREVVGDVTFVSRSADPLTRTFRVEIEVPNPDTSIRDGLSADILIGLDGAKGHFLPQSALTLDDGGNLGVRTNEDGITGFAPVTIIRDQSDGIWVAGLPDTAEVIVVGQDYVTTGRTLKVTYEAEATQ